MAEGHRRTDMPWSLNAPAFTAKTGGATRSFEQSEESSPGLGFRRSSRPRPARYDRTSRNMIDIQPGTTRMAYIVTLNAERAFSGLCHGIALTGAYADV